MAGELVNRGNLGLCRPGVRIVRVAALAFAAIVLTSCNSTTFVEANNNNNNVDVLDKIRSLDLLPRSPKQVGTNELSAGKQAHPAIYNGVEGADVAVAEGRSQTRPQTRATGDGFDLNFENTPVTTVAKVVLGDILGLGYTIDPRVQGTVNLASVRPVAKSDILFVLEGALRLSGTVLVKDTAGYRLAPLGDAVGSGNVEAAGESPEAGYGISVVPLQYVSAQTLLKLLDSYALKPGTVRADLRRNLLLIQGSGVERRTAVDAALSFDADWMRGQSVGIFPITNGNPDPVIAELEKIMDAGDGGLGQNVVKFQVISRMNAILVVTSKPAMLRTAATWIKRLDSANTSKNSVHVYRVKYGEARQIARVLTDMFIGGSANTSVDAQTSQLAPGSGATATSSAGLNTGQSQSGGFGVQSQSGGFGGQSQSGGFGGQQQSGTGLVANRGFGGAPATATYASAGLGGSGVGSGGAGKPILEGVRITPDIVNNTLLIYADQENYRLIEGTLQQVDRPQLQVAIEATIAEVTLNDGLAYGVQSFITSKQVGLKPDQGSSVLNTDPSSANSAAGTIATGVTSAIISRTLPGFNFLVGSEAQPAIILNALNSLTSVKVLSNPSLVVIDNQVATLQVGDSVPVSTGSAIAASSTVVNTVDYKNTGIILRVSPRVNVNGNVRLDIEQEISQVSSTSNTGTLTPTVSERKVKSSISVASGQTVLLAGLISEARQGAHSGLPLLDDLPYIGGAFGQQSKASQRTELIIFIRPQIIRDGTDAHYVAEELRSKLRGTIKANVDNTRHYNVE